MILQDKNEKEKIKKGSETVLKHIEFKSEDNKTRVEEFIKEIRNPRTHAKE